MHTPPTNRYDTMAYRRAGESGLILPRLSLGLWHNFGEQAKLATVTAMCRTAMDAGITHFDLANNYGPPPGSAEATFGKLLQCDFKHLRDELIISTKAGYDMWPGPYGRGGGRKHLLASLDQSLQRLGLEYVDIFYSHCYDPNTPLEETMSALASTVKQGKALYVGISSYPPRETQQAALLLRNFGTPCVLHQPVYSMFNRTIEDQELLPLLESENMGCIVFSPLAQGMLSNRYLSGIPEDSRAAANHFLPASELSAARLEQIAALNSMAAQRNQTLAQMAISWVLRDPRITSAIIGASSPGQISDCVKGATSSTPFTADELHQIDVICGAEH